MFQWIDKGMDTPPEKPATYKICVRFLIVYGIRYLAGINLLIIIDTGVTRRLKPGEIITKKES